MCQDSSLAEKQEPHPALLLVVLSGRLAGAKPGPRSSRKRALCRCVAWACCARSRARREASPSRAGLASAATSLCRARSPRGWVAPPVRVRLRASGRRRRARSLPPCHPNSHEKRGTEGRDRFFQGDTADVRQRPAIIGRFRSCSRRSAGGPRGRVRVLEVDEEVGVELDSAGGVAVDAQLVCSAGRGRTGCPRWSTARHLAVHGRDLGLQRPPSTSELASSCGKPSAWTARPPWSRSCHDRDLLDVVLTSPPHGASGEATRARRALGTSLWRDEDSTRAPCDGACDQTAASARRAARDCRSPRPTGGPTRAAGIAEPRTVQRGAHHKLAHIAARGERLELGDALSGIRRRLGDQHTGERVQAVGVHPEVGIGHPHRAHSGVAQSRQCRTRSPAASCTRPLARAAIASRRGSPMRQPSAKA